MKVLDLTHCIYEGMPVYPGTEGPSLKIANTYDEDGFQETLMTMYSHTGTHMDPPAHIYPNGRTLDAFSIEQFVGSALVIDCHHLIAGERITMKEIEPVRGLADQAEFLLFYTGWDQYWGDPRYFGEYPTMDDAVAEYLINHHKKGIGLDVIGLDPISDENLTLHKKVFLDHDMVIVENLRGLGQIGTSLFTLCALPLKYLHADGSPIRAIALLDDKLNA